MSEAEVIGAVLIGFAGGVASGLLGGGGGILFVPGLVFFLSQPQLSAEATSLVAIVPVAIVGAVRQHGYGNLRVHEGLTIGLLALPGTAAGALIADSVDEHLLELGFAAVQIVFAVGLARRALERNDSAV